MSVRGHAQGHVALECRLQGAEQECEAGGGVECLPDFDVSVPGEPGLGDAQLGCVVTHTE